MGFSGTQPTPIKNPGQRLKSPAVVLTVGGDRTKKSLVYSGLFLVILSWILMIAVPAVLPEIATPFGVVTIVLFVVGMYSFAWGFVVELF